MVGGCWVGAAGGMLVWGAVFSCLPCCFGAGCIDCCGFRGLSWVWWFVTWLDCFLIWCGLFVGRVFAVLLAV